MRYLPHTLRNDFYFFFQTHVMFCVRSILYVVPSYVIHKFNLYVCMRTKIDRILANTANFRIECFRQQVCRTNVDWHSNDSSLADFLCFLFLANYTHFNNVYNGQRKWKLTHINEMWIQRSMFFRMNLVQNFFFVPLSMWCDE